MIQEIGPAICSQGAVTKTREALVNRWGKLVEQYLPVLVDDSPWRYSRENKADDALQGWKLHVSATIFDACDVFEKLVGVVTEAGVQFKAPDSLDELARINCGLYYGYHQVGKFITIYPPTLSASLELAAAIHSLTEKFISIPVPFDNQYLPNSSVFYRYGAFQRLELIDENGLKVPAILHPDGPLVRDDRLCAVPAWLDNPFPEANVEEVGSKGPLSKSYRVFKAITQRGKGGTYLAGDLTNAFPRFCVVKEGRRYGELNWNGQDGFALAMNEAHVLRSMRKKLEIVPEVYSAFQVSGNFYVVMEYIEGKSLFELMRSRKRRYPIKRIIELSIQIADILANIDSAGWVWNDCKPANLIVTREGPMRPIDFEGAHRKGEMSLFDWKSVAFSMQYDEGSPAESNDIFSFGAVMFYLLTGRFYDSNEPEKIDTLRRNVPSALRDLIERLINQNDGKRKIPPNELKAELEKIYFII